MTLAEQHGKLRHHDSIEDLLTSDVFGAARYLAPGQLLIPALKQARNPSTGVFLEFPTGIEFASYQFWPWTGCAEPDVLIQLFKSDHEVFRVLVEAKYFSGKSSFAVEDTGFNVSLPDGECSDQLAREYSDLLRSAGELPHALVYLTRYSKGSVHDLEVAISELHTKGIVADRNRFFLLDWSAFWIVAQALAMELQGTLRLIAMDLRDLLHRKNLSRFQGIGRSNVFHKLASEVILSAVKGLKKRGFATIPATAKNALWERRLVFWNRSSQAFSFPLLEGTRKLQFSLRTPVFLEESARG